METTIKEEVKHLRVGGTDVYLHEYGEGKGKLTISNTYGNNYSHYWGAMGESLSEFIKTINSEYFANKLLGYRNDSQQMDVKKTFTQLRKFFREEMDLPFYKHMEFQKDLREKLKDFQKDCEDMNSQEYFVYNFFPSFINKLDYYLIDGRFDQREVEDSFKGICEQWCFIVTKPSDEYTWLMKFHKLLVKELKKKKQYKKIIKNKIKLFTLEDYNNLKSTGMFWVLYPEATGVYEEDKKLSEEGKFSIEKD